MIKLGWMARATDAEVFEEQVKFASDLDLDVIDFHLGGMPREMDFIMKIKMRCVRAGLPIGYLGGGSMVGPPEEREQRLAKGREDVEIASVMGAQMLRVFARHKWPDSDQEQAKLWRPMIADFKSLADYATEKGVILGLQNHDNGSFCMTGEQALRILSEVNKDNLTFLWDTGQWLGSIGSDPRGEFDPKVDIYEDYLVPTAFCASSVRAKIYQIDTGVETYLDYPRIFKILQDVGYNGNISIVYEGAEGRNTCTREEGIALGAKYLRKVIGEVYR
jgi:sugar phosphate isomerase/epimerase